MAHEGFATRWGSRDAVLVGTRLLALLYGLAALAELVLLDGVARFVLAGLAAVTAVLFGLAARVALTVGDRAVDALLVLVCLVPLANVLTHLAVTRQAQQSMLVVLVVVAAGAVAGGRRTGWSLVAVSLVSWSAVVLLRPPRPGAVVPFHALVILLACVLSVAVLEIRLVAYRRLSRAISRSDLGLRRFRSVFDDSPVGIGLVDEHGVFVEANGALCAVLDRPPGEVRGHPATDFVHRGDRAGQRPTPGEQVERRYVRPDGEVRWVGVSDAAVAGPQGQRWTVLHLQDVTERRRAVDDLRLSRESMVASVEIAQATQQGHDPRPVVLHHLRRLAGASFVSLWSPWVRTGSW